MAYTDGDTTRADQADAGNGTDAIRSKVRNSQTYQVIMTNDADGTFSNSGATLKETQSATASAGAVYEVRANLDGSASADYWFCVVDKATAPATADTIVDAVRVSKNGTSTITYPTGLPLSSGLGLCLSTTLTTVTLPSDAKARFTWNADTIA